MAIVQVCATDFKLIIACVFRSIPMRNWSQQEAFKDCSVIDGEGHSTLEYSPRLKQRHHDRFGQHNAL